MFHLADRLPRVVGPSLLHTPVPYIYSEMLVTFY